MLNQGRFTITYGGLILVCRHVALPERYTGKKSTSQLRMYVSSGFLHEGWSRMDQIKLWGDVLVAGFLHLLTRRLSISAPTTFHRQGKYSNHHAYIRFGVLSSFTCYD